MFEVGRFHLADVDFIVLHDDLHKLIEMMNKRLRWSWMGCDHLYEPQRPVLANRWSLLLRCRISKLLEHCTGAVGRISENPRLEVTFGDYFEGSRPNYDELLPPQEQPKCKVIEWRTSSFLHTSLRLLVFSETRLTHKSSRKLFNNRIAGCFRCIRSKLDYRMSFRRIAWHIYTEFSSLYDVRIEQKQWHCSHCPRNLAIWSKNADASKMFKTHPKQGNS